MQLDFLDGQEIDVTIDTFHCVGYWTPEAGSETGKPLSLAEGLQRIHEDAFVVLQDEELCCMMNGVGHIGPFQDQKNSKMLVSVAPACPLDNLGDQSFIQDHGLRYPYYAGAMANGIASEELVESLGRAGMLGFFGAAGLPPKRIEAALKRLTESMDGLPFGVNLINSPNEPRWQQEVADLLLQYGVRLVEASAYISLSLPLIKYRVKGLYRDKNGKVVAPNKVIAKASRVEVASRFFAAPPERMLDKLLASGEITEEEATLAKEIPVAQDLTAESDSGGHTDHRPAITLLPALLKLRDEMQAQYNYPDPLRVGLGGGIGTPMAAAAAFSMGAAYIVTGSVNQACVEAGTSDYVKALLADATQTDVEKAPAADMFEMGVTVQVLKKGCRYGVRGAKLYDTYKEYDSIDEIPADERSKLEEQIFRAPLEDIWEQTKQFFQQIDPTQIEKAEKRPRHKMALIFRWYLGQSSGWALRGVADRQEDYQIWCGPAMGAFNDWTKGSHLEEPTNRKVVDVALNLLYGAAVQLRINSLRLQGLTVSSSDAPVTPRTMKAMTPYLVSESLL